MLQNINKIGRSWLGKVVVAILFGFLIVSFAIWGIGDIFRGSVSTTVARVGNTDISAEAFRTAYQNELQRLMRQTRQSITPDRARALGLDTQILSRLVSEAALDQKAKELGLAVSDQLVARTITQDPNFRGPNGQFDRAAFDDILRSNSLSEAAFVREQRGVVTRLQLADAIAGALPVPLAMRETIHRYGAERRSAAYVLLSPAAAGDIPAPTEEQLKTYFEEHKAAFRAPEYRAVNAVALGPETLAKPEQVSDADARQRYEQVKGSRYGTPERRTIQQIVFPNLEEAEATFKRIKDGATFEAIAAERNVDPKSLELGTFSRTELIDPAVANAAFSLAEGAVSGPVQGRFGPVLVRVTKIEPENVKPFEQVAAEVKREVALERARNTINEVHDAIEDLRAGAKPLAEIAKEKGLPLVSIPAIDRTGRDKAGNPVPNLPERDALLTAVFTSDVGVDKEPLRTRAGGYVWYDVTGIEPARDKAFEEVREAVAAQWRNEEVSRRLSDKARTLVERIDKGEPVEAVAAELGVPAQTATDLARNATQPLSADVVARIFSTPVGKAASAPSGENGRAVFKVTAATVPPFVTSSREASAIEERLRVALSEDLLAQYIAQIEKDIGVSVNQQNLRRAVGGDI
ncbi:MAG TPA: SurA N-terminal domain-containing protein [Beijerinckiaceae bacterium]|jgi:peptidyl-prolyl cis-trans isomerase D|nr:SurA N-terminal domain-containing protein [Beijerinckiaceae bacterium]